MLYTRVTVYTVTHPRGIVMKIGINNPFSLLAYENIIYCLIIEIGL